MRFRYILLIVIALNLSVVSFSHVQAQTLSGANDYQLLTQNPPTNITTGSQTNSAGSQSIPGQAGVNLQTLSSSGGISLQNLAGSSETIIAPTTVPTKPRKSINLWLIVGVLGLVAYGVFRLTNSKQPKPVSGPDQPLPKPKLTKKTAKKKKPRSKRKK